MIIKFWCLRHGEKRGKDHPEGEDGLTDRGKLQVVTAAAAHLQLDFFWVFYSGLNRARETATLALDAIHDHLCDEKLIMESGLDYRWVNDREVIPAFITPPEVEKWFKENKVENPTVFNWFEKWPPCLGMRQMMLATIKYKASELAKKYMYKNVINVLMASHSPVLETAVPNPKEFPRLGEADICVYTVEASGAEVKILSAEYLPCPPVL